MGGSPERRKRATDTARGGGGQRGQSLEEENAEGDAAAASAPASAAASAAASTAAVGAAVGAVEAVEAVVVSKKKRIKTYRVKFSRGCNIGLGLSPFM